MIFQLFGKVWDFENCPGTDVDDMLHVSSGGHSENDFDVSSIFIHKIIQSKVKSHQGFRVEVKGPQISCQTSMDNLNLSVTNTIR